MPTAADYEKYDNWAVILDKDPNVDPRTRQRTVPMQVISASWPRTGSLSMHTALTILGYPTYHYSTVMGNVKDADMWVDALKAKYHGIGRPFGKAEFDQLLGDVAAVTDTPCMLFYKELHEFYPDTKVILVEREEEKWKKSMAQVVSNVLTLSRTPLYYLDYWTLGRVLRLGRYWIEASFGSTQFDEAMSSALPRYHAHNAEVRATIAKDKLLVYKLGSGWKPLCDFLEKPIPDVPFPHRNEAAVIERTFELTARMMLKRVTVNFVLIPGLAVAFGTAVWYLRKRFLLNMVHFI